MTKFYELLPPFLLAFVLSTNVEGQANPNYVYYNPNLDVYRKPDMHILAKAITAQNELAMAKLAHLGMLQAPRFEIFLKFCNFFGIQSGWMAGHLCPL